MVACSKLFKEAIMSMKCSDFHEGIPCIRHAFITTHSFLLSSARYFAPLTLLQLLLKIRGMNRSLLLQIFKYNVECALFSATMSWSFKVFLCVFYNVLGGFHPWTFAYLPAIISGSIVLLASQRVQILFKITAFQGFIESELLRRRNVLTRTIANSRAWQTWIFMCCSAIILQAKCNGVYRGFWLYSPPTPSQQHNNNDISHVDDAAFDNPKERNGLKNVLLSMSKYVAIGVALDVLKMLIDIMPKRANTRKRDLLLVKMSSLRLNSTAMLTSYVGIYKLIEYYSKQWRLPQWKCNEWLAGFFAGLSYIFLPKLTLLTYSITLAIRILWHYYELRPIHPVDETKKYTRLRKILNRLEQAFKYNRLSYASIMYTLSLAYIIHNACMAKPYVSKLGESIIDGMTNNYANNIKLTVMATDQIMKAAAKVTAT